MKTGQTIIVISRDPVLCRIIEGLLADAYNMLFFRDIRLAITCIYDSPPNLLIVDTPSKDSDMVEIIASLKGDPIFSQLPVLAIIGNEKEVSLTRDFFMDDYLQRSQLEKTGLFRTQLTILRSERISDLNPLTRLPGNISISQTVQTGLESGRIFALAYADLDHFKPFNDHYGFSRGDELIRITGRLILNIVKSKEPKTGFTGHIGGDDFIYILSVENVEEVSLEIIDAFDKIVPTLYDRQDRERGFIETLDRQGNARKFPVTSLSIGIATNRNRPFNHFGELTGVASEMKKAAKQSWGSCYLLDRRA